MLPAALLGLDLAAILRGAVQTVDECRDGGGGPAFALATALGAGVATGRDKLTIQTSPRLAAFGDWAEQLIAESTGKAGTGIVPIVGEPPAAAEAYAADRCFVFVALASEADPALSRLALDLRRIGHRVEKIVLADAFKLEAEVLRWEVATAAAGIVLGIDPFDQPNVQESKDNTKRILTEGLPSETALFVDGAIEVYYDGAAPPVDTLGPLLAWFLGGVDGYLAIMAYLDRFADAEVGELRPRLAATTGRPVTFGWGPRFLHSTGQYHKGGPVNGRYLQITGAVAEDLPIPGQPYTFGLLQAAQAAGDRVALSQRAVGGVLRLHLTDRRAGIAQLLEVAP